MLQGTSFRETREAAREIKFLVTLPQAEEVLAWARRRLAPDPHATEAGGDEYRTCSLYFDTADMAVYRRRGSYRRSKHRIRRYGDSPLVFLERKLRTATLLSKRRTLVPIEDLSKLQDANRPDGWVGWWFSQRLAARRLGPICQVSYRRHARIGSGLSGPMRLTVDSEIMAEPCSRIGFQSAETTPVLTTRAIIEMKYCAEIPPVFKQLVEEFGLSPAAISKYRLSLEALRDAGATADGVDFRALASDCPETDRRIVNA